MRTALVSLLAGCSGAILQNRSHVSEVVTDVFDINRNTEYLEDRYGCEIIFEDGFESASDKERALIHLKAVLVKYPPSLIKGYGFSFQLRNISSGLGGTADGEGHVEIFTKIPEDRNPATFENPSPFHEIHHEFDLQNEGVTYNLEDWVALNPGGESDYVGDDWEEYTDIRPAGFSDAYGKSSPREDQADLASYLFLMPDFPEKFAPEDIVLANKAKMIKHMYLIWSKGLMDDEYWTDLANGKVNEAYWDTRFQ